MLDYLLIFGKAGFPELGVTGAALGTVLSQVAGAAVFLALMLQRRHRVAYRTLAGWRLEPWLVARLVRFGMPTGLQYSLEVAAFALFMIIVGRIGTLELAASGIAFNLNMIVFFPMVGLAIAVSSLVGRYLGAEQPEVAERAVASAFKMSLVYMTLCGLVYVFGAPLLLAPYAAAADPATFPTIAAIATVLLRFVALYSIFDMLNLIHAAGLRGAGDTRLPDAADPGARRCGDAAARRGRLPAVRAGRLLRLDHGQPVRVPARPADAAPVPLGPLEDAARDRDDPCPGRDAARPAVRSSSRRFARRRAGRARGE